MNQVAERLDSVNRLVGSVVRWFALLMMLLQFLVVLLRYIFGFSDIALNESVLYLHAGLFMLGAGYTLLVDGHVRVDIFYRGADVRRKALVDLLGSLLLLLPVVALIFSVSFGYVADSWARLEESREAGGLPGLFLLKTVILAFCLLLGLQGLSLAGRSLLLLQGRTELLPPCAAGGGREAGDDG